MNSRFTFESIPLIDRKLWTEHRKKVNTKMIRIDGPFDVETKEGPLHCADGFLAVDVAGWPYPISVADYRDMYVPVDPFATLHQPGKTLSRVFVAHIDYIEETFEEVDVPVQPLFPYAIRECE